MTLFVVFATAMTLAAVAAVLVAPLRQRQQEAAASQARTSAAVLRQQLAELDVERTRGLIDEADFARMRDELQRRLLDDATMDSPLQASGSHRPRRALLLVAISLPLAAVALYAQFGHPQLLATPAGDAGGAASSAADEGDRMLVQLEGHVAASPDDARAWVMLARTRMQGDRFTPAAAAYARALETSAKVARDPLIWCEYADALGMAAGGRLAGKPREMIDRALALDASHPRALEMAGSAAYEAGDFRAAARYWKQLLAQLPAESTEHTQLAAAIARAEQRARFTLPQS
jgi:cytochrome c-type biogenesis protein CcmH